MALGAGVSVVASGGGISGVKQYEGHITIYVLFASILATSTAVMGGYDAGITGGVAQMNNFLEKFFPAVYARKQLSVKIGSSHNIYCQYNSQALQAYSASISLAAAVSTLFASYFTRNYGRKTTLIYAGVLSIIGVILKAAAQNLGMLLVGRIIIGFGLGFTIQVSDDFHILVSSESKQEHFLTNSLF
jgi:MFS family permease